MARNTDAVYVATETGVIDVRGKEYPFHKGITRVRAGHPMLKGHEHLFTLVDDVVHYDVEAATSAPGEKRGGSSHGV